MPLSFADYQTEAGKTLNTEPDYQEQLANLALGAASEVGEIAQRIRKALFQHADLDRAELKKEIGDALWYLTNLANHLDMELEEVASENLAKLNARYGGAQYDPGEAKRRQAKRLG